MSFPASHFIFLLAGPPPSLPPSRCHTPPPVFLSWGENMVCTSGGDPDSPVGKRCQVKDTLHSVCLNPCVPGGCHVIRTPNAADYKQLAGSSLSQLDKLLAVTSEGGRRLSVGYLYYVLFILRSDVELKNVLTEFKMCLTAFVHLSSCSAESCSVLPNVCCCLQHSKKAFVLMWASCGFVKEKQKTPLEPECRLECTSPLHKPITKMLKMISSH